MDTQAIEQFGQRLHAILQRHPQGLSEHELLQMLREADEDALGAARLDDSLNLFQTHFILFHALYRLRERLLAGGDETLWIHVLRIQLLPLEEKADRALGGHDPLRDYYLDWSNLEQTSAADVEAMLGRFWQRYLRQDQRVEALRVLELDAGADATAIRDQYRRLAMRHHPDRGGDTATLQAINEAAALLLGKGGSR
ncbi:MAG: molecular chaperone DnaJ [Gammaproteobacteria bacterium]|nr:molecular chaperone DnaJ [Gammaproteobacteria bacterium]